MEIVRVSNQESKRIMEYSKDITSGFLKPLNAGVSFGVKDSAQTTWKADKIDFVFRIVNRKQWAIGIFKQSMKDLIGKIESKTDFPKVCKLFKNGLL
ncbi:MAG: hypothetical protein LE168_05995 [Endomicrobium sp.]|nr:hypothetical protein [Endomicrobium sp.]